MLKQIASNCPVRTGRASTILRSPLWNSFPVPEAQRPSGAHSRRKGDKIWTGTALTILRSFPHAVNLLFNFPILSKEFSFIFFSFPGDRSVQTSFRDREKFNTVNICFHLFCFGLWL